MVKVAHRMVANVDIGRLDFLSFMNFAFSASRREKSELFAWLDKHDFASRPEMMTQSIAVSFDKKAPMPKATISPGRDLF